MTSEQPPNISQPANPNHAPSDWVMHSLNSIDKKIDSLTDKMESETGELKMRIRKLEQSAYKVLGGFLVIATIFTFVFSFIFISFPFEIKIVPTTYEVESSSDGQ